MTNGQEADKFVCNGMGLCLKENCWCKGEVYVHGFADKSGYCSECRNRITLHKRFSEVEK